MKLPKIPKGWACVPVGERLRRSDKVCAWPHKKWALLASVPDGVIHKDGNYLPYVYYIREKAKGRK